VRVFDGRVNSPIVLGSSSTPVDVTADVTTEVVLATITVPANTLGLNGKLRVTTTWGYTNGANDKILRVRFSGAAGTQYLSTTATTTATNQIITIFGNAGATNSQRGFQGSNGVGTSGSAIATSAADTTTATSIVISGQKEVGSETLTLEGYTVEFLPGV
jgi:hypothetical protein